MLELLQNQVENQKESSAFFNSSPIGTLYMPYEIDGIEIPTNEKWIRLVAGESDAGEFNEGKLINETILGIFPTNIATAQINDSESPLFEKIIHLLETERRFLRAGNVGTIQEFAMQGHKHTSAAAEVTSTRPVGGGVQEAATIGTQTGNPITDGVNNTPLTDNETRPRNIGTRVYLKIRA